MCIRDSINAEYMGKDLMENVMLKCIVHDALNELVCDHCKAFVCTQCLTEHIHPGKAPKFIHILKYAPENILPKIDSIVAEIQKKSAGIEEDAHETIKALSMIIKKLNDIVDGHGTRIKHLKSVVGRLSSYGKMKLREDFGSSIASGIKADKEKLEQAIKDQNIRTAAQLTLKVESELALNEKQESAVSLVKKMEVALTTMDNLEIYKEATNLVTLLLNKFHSLRFAPFESEWTIDKQYISTKMSVSEDGLTYHPTVSNGYPAIIGTISTEIGQFAYRVIPESLCCNGKEGFGIIDKKKYLAAVGADPVTPTVYDSMIGFCYNQDVKNMKVEQSSVMQMGAKYYVKVDMQELKCTITGPGLHLVAELESGVAYAPCFSVGCTSNRLKIKPLSSFEEETE
eukprot:TRINITY_DN42847_c0_g2_i2.p1 TRINITY_DN42847_c0_g2~~TRINITY_DN42847_c0_g2_i2.p1  ORF type:complete len:410 (-),score=77.99 TRINITY_DN42847_c0_g2_i2:86-1282(-)